METSQIRCTLSIHRAPSARRGDVDVGAEMFSFVFDSTAKEAVRDGSKQLDRFLQDGNVSAIESVAKGHMYVIRAPWGVIASARI